MSSRITPLPTVLYILVGTACWFGAGYLTGYSSLRLTDALGGPDSEIKEIASVLNSTALRVGAVWALFGAAAGLLIMVFYFTRPLAEYSARARHLGHRLPRAGEARTVAEAKTVPVAALVGIAGGLLLSVFYVPSIELPSGIVFRGDVWRIAVGCFSTMGTTLGIMPTSLWVLGRMAGARR